MHYIKPSQRTAPDKPFRIVLMLFFITVISVSTDAQYRRLMVGGGIAPLHQPGQTDFSSVDMPYAVHAAFFQGNIGVRLDYNWHGSYEKERFSTTKTSMELSLQYSLRQKFKLSTIDPYVRLGLAKWSTVLTTEGYPGINDYEFKIEEDSGFGPVGAIGGRYMWRQASIGLEVQYAKHGTAQFIAGGFDPQPLVTDQLRLMVTAAYTFSVTSDARGGIVYCPSF